MRDLTPPAAALLEQRLEDLDDVVAAHRALTEHDLAEHDRHIGRCDDADAAQKRELAAQESRIHSTEIQIHSIDQSLIVVQQQCRKLEDRCDWLTQRFDDVFVALRSRGIGLSDFGTEGRARGIPKHGGPVGTGLMGVNESPPPNRHEIHEQTLEGLGGM